LTRLLTGARDPGHRSRHWLTVPIRERTCVGYLEEAVAGRPSGANPHLIGDADGLARHQKASGIEGLGHPVSNEWTQSRCAVPSAAKNARPRPSGDSAMNWPSGAWAGGAMVKRTGEETAGLGRMSDQTPRPVAALSANATATACPAARHRGG